MVLSKMCPKSISETCSPRHIQNVIEDLLEIIKKQNKLAQEVIDLNPKCNEIGAGKLANMQELAKEIIWE